MQGYSYDQYGNRAVTYPSNVSPLPNGSKLSRPDWTPTGLSQYNASNQWSRGAGDHYVNGDQTSIASVNSPNSASSTFTYDAEHRMTSANISGYGTVQYTYDGDGKRVSKTVGTTTTIYVYDAFGNMAAEYTTGALSSPGTMYLTADHLGSTRVVTDSSKNVLEEYDFTPFGEDIPLGSPNGANGRSWGFLYQTGYPASPDIESQKFTGKERDAETGLDFFGARYFSGAMGRFTSADPKHFPHDITDPQSWNKYAYTRSNPLRYTDPDGEDFWDFIGGVGNATRSNAVAGLGRETGNSDFRLGQKVGDVISMVGGAIEMAGGGTVAGGGAAACATGVGCLAGAPTALGGAAIAVHGASEFGTAAVSLMGSSGDAPQSGAGNDALVGNNPRDASGRVNTDLPGGHQAAKDTFGQLTEGQKVQTEPGSGHQVAEDKTRLRLNPDGTARVDIPRSETRPQHETVHFNNPDKPQN